MIVSCNRILQYMRLDVLTNKFFQSRLKILYLFPEKIHGGLVGRVRYIEMEVARRLDIVSPDDRGSFSRIAGMGSHKAIEIIVLSLHSEVKSTSAKNAHHWRQTIICQCNRFFHVTQNPHRDDIQGGEQLNRGVAAEITEYFLTMFF